VATIILIVVIMAIVGVIVGFVGGLIWKGNRPIGVQGDYLVAIVSAIVIGFIDWYVIPAMGFSDTLKYIGIALEPALGALLILWIVRLAKR
jgi:uncharacterized membrane protein YeaQ/YmgE (transglycosylase-associated protein family)